MKKSFALKLICSVLILCMIIPTAVACNINDIVEKLENENNSTADSTEAITDKPVEENTTETPADEAPTTEAPTTEAPTTEEPTDDSKEECEHEWVDANCEFPKTCSKCQETEGEALGHVEVIEKGVAPTCLESGICDGKHCSRCSEVLVEQKPVGPLGHDFTWSRNCTRCDEVNAAGIENLDIDSSDMHGNMQNIFSGDTVHYETVMFIDKGETKALLFPIDEVVSLQSYDGRKKYVEGKDYEVIDGKLHIPTTSSINVITSKRYYNYSGQNGAMIYEKYNGVNVPVYWGEGSTMTTYQIRVTYKHSKTWDGFRQESYAKNFEGLIKKLMAGEDVTFIFYGDSITCGSNSSWFIGTPTLDWYETKAFYQWSYSMLFTQAIADMFGYTIHFVDASNLHPLIKKIPDDYVGGTNGTITYINTSVGGWTSEGGLNNFDRHIKPFIEEYGCDLLGIAFGMNDAAFDPSLTAENIKEIYLKAMELDSDFYGLVISTMLPNNKATNGWFGNQQYQEETLKSDVVDYLNANGVGAGIARVTSVSEAMLERIDFRDYTGNNINHPNDFMQRVYAQTCLQAFIGYENMK